jgi:hypothetical protein
LAGGVRALAQPAGDADKPAAPAQERDAAWLEKLIPALDSDDFAKREAASKEIADDSGVSLHLIEQRLCDKAHPLTPEQALRLGEAGLRLFANTQRGAMGVQFAAPGMEGSLDGVKVGMAVDGFDSKRVLKSGDVIRDMDGVSLAVGDQSRSRNLVVALIISHDPGDEVTLNLLRNGEPLVVKLALGSYRDLRNANELDTARLRTAWDLRCRRLQGGEEPQAADAGLSAERWTQISDPVRRLAMRRVATQRQNVNPFMVQAQQQEQPAPDTGVTLIAGGAGRDLLSEPPSDFSASERGQRNAARIQQVNQQIQFYNTLLQRDVARQKDPNLAEGTKRMLQANINSYKQQLNVLRAQKKQLVGMEP